MTDAADLTLTEKAALTSGASLWLTEAVPRLGIPAIRFSDGPHGLRRQPEDGDHLGLGSSLPATCFPPAVALGSSWDPELARRVGEALGREAAALGVNVLLGPGVNIKRSPLCGRNFEYLSEDPHLSGRLGAAFVEGVQSCGVGASVKHFAANNQETDRLRVSADVDERTLREVYLAAFEHVVKVAGPWTVMCSYNRVNGVYASQNRWLLTEVLREEWGFDGLVVSDWGAVDDRVEGLRAGLDLEMPTSGGSTDLEVFAAVSTGLLDAGVLDASVRRLLTLVDRTSAAEARPVDETEHHALAREAAAQCAVLLRNDGVLPLGRETRVAVVGEMAVTPRYQGAGSSLTVPTRLDDALTEMRLLADRSIPFASGEVVEEARAVAAEAEVTVVFLGLPASEESEGYDRTHLELPAAQIALMETVIETGTRVVVVLSNGGVVRVSDWDGRVGAVLEGWLLGQAGGGAIADILYGVVNPSGRLAETIPLRLADTPSYLSFPGELGHARYGEGVFVGYRHHDAVEGPVAYPFGHGLSYTTFGYDDLSVSSQGADEELSVEVSVRVTNTGERAGAEVVQLYVEAPSLVVRRPVRELRGFRKVWLEAGASVEVRFGLGLRDFAYFNAVEGRWVVEDGTVTVHVGASSRDLRLSAEARLKVSEERAPVGPDSLLADWLAVPGGLEVLRREMGETSRFLSETGRRTMGSIPVTRIARFPGAGLDPGSLERLAAELNGDPR